MSQPELKIYRQFRLPVIVWRYPVRLLLWCVFLILFYPDLSETSPAFSIAVILGTFFLVYAMPIMTTFLEYKRIPVLFFDDRIEMRESLLIKDAIKIRYAHVIEAKCSANKIQKYYGLQTLCLKLKSGSDHHMTKEYWFKMTDIKRGENIKAICSACGIV